MITFLCIDIVPETKKQILENWEETLVYKYVQMIEENPDSRSVPLSAKGVSWQQQLQQAQQLQWQQQQLQLLST